MLSESIINPALHREACLTRAQLCFELEDCEQGKVHPGQCDKTTPGTNERYHLESITAGMQTYRAAKDHTCRGKCEETWTSAYAAENE